LPTVLKIEIEREILKYLMELIKIGKEKCGSPNKLQAPEMIQLKIMIENQSFQLTQ
jgi:hypothetical protein